MFAANQDNFEWAFNYNMMILFHFNICMLNNVELQIRQKKRYDSKEKAHNKRRRDE